MTADHGIFSEPIDLLGPVAEAVHDRERGAVRLRPRGLGVTVL